jgi:hypothetical protein
MIDLATVGSIFWADLQVKSRAILDTHLIAGRECFSWMLLQERHEIFDATGGVAVTDVMGRRVVVK